MAVSTDIHYYDTPSRLRGMAKSAILQIATPFLLLWFLAAVFVAPDISIAFMTGGCFAIIIFTTLLIRSKNKLHHRKLLLKFKLEGRFDPQMELHTRSYSEYLGLDTQNGTIVYFWSVNNKEHLISRNMLAVGFTNYNWRKCELHGNKLTIYTHDPIIPYIEFTHSRAPALYERLCAMRNLDFSYDVNFPGWIDYQATNVAKELNLNLIKIKH